jgi:hypothetical protein
MKDTAYYIVVKDGKYAGIDSASGGYLYWTTSFLGAERFPSIERIKDYLLQHWQKETAGATIYPILLGNPIEKL